MNSGLPDRKIMRLKGYDYNRQGVIFLTVCTLDRKCILSQIRMQEDQNVPSVLLSEYGRIAEKYLIQIGSFYDFIKIESYVIMPNHIHMLLHIFPKEDCESNTPRDSFVSRFISTFKRFCNREYGRNIWQSRSYDHVIRDKADYDAKIRYIYENPKRWWMDELYASE
ncbi:MAG: transposase [Clostridia bacterium]|nr:transposase [Clostridia bacterium]